MTATKIQPGDDLHLTSLMAPHSLNFVTGPDRAALLAYGRDVFAAARDSKCLAQIEEPAQPVAEICSASHDDAEFGERAIKPLRDISGFEYGTPLYAGAAPAAVAPQGEYPQLPEGVMFIEQVGGDVIGRPTDYGFKHGRGIVHGAQLFTSEQLRAYFDLGRQQEAGAPGLTDGQLEDESYRVNDEPGFSDAFRAGARFAERVHGVTAAAARALTGEADWWRGRADEIEAQVARSGSKEAMRCYTDMRTLLQAAAPALEAPAAVEFAMAYGGRRVSAYGKRGDPVLLYPDDLARMLAAAPQAPAAPAVDAALNALIADVRALPTLRASEIDGEESDGTPKHWRNRPFVSLRKLELLLRDRVMASSDTALLNFIAAEYLDLRSFGMPTGQGDADVGWRVIQHHMGEPTERVVAEVYKDDPRSAIRAAIARLERDPYCTGALHEEDAAQAAAKGAA
jgi:hypothetical protein